MGLFNLFKKNKESVLALPEKYSGGFIQPLVSSQIEIKLGQKLQVNEGWSAVIVVKDKPQDVFGAGEHELSIPSLPKTTHALKLDKSKIVKKKGKSEVVFKNSFKCDLYFVSLAPFTNQPWHTGNLLKKSKKFGRYNVAVSGTCTFQTVNVANTIKLFLLEWAKISAGKAQLRLQDYISEFASSALEWSKENNPEIINDKVKVAALIEPAVSKNLEKYGIKITDFVADKVDFGRAVAALLEQKKRDNEETSAEDIVNNIDFDSDKTKEPETVTVSVEKERSEESSAVLDLEKVEQNNEPEPVDIDLSQNKVGTVEPITEDELEPIDFTKLSDTELLQKQIKVKKKRKNDTQERKITATKKQEIQEPQTENKDEVQLDEDTKKCPNCGKIHEKNDQICDCGCILE